MRKALTAVYPLDPLHLVSPLAPLHPTPGFVNYLQPVVLLMGDWRAIHWLQVIYF
jgi:hypothetical protein